jgi:hypothetical protein
MALTQIDRSSQIKPGDAYRILANDSTGKMSENAAITADSAVASDAHGQLVASATTAIELGYVSGVTSAIQTQLNGKQATLTIGNLTDVGTDGITVTNGTGAVIGTGTSLSQHVADASDNGYLSSTDWSTFNSKQSALTFSTGLLNSSGTVTNTGVLSVNSNTGAITLAGTTDEVIITDSPAGTFTFSLPQVIATTSSPTFSGLKLSGLTASEIVGTDGSDNLVSVATTGSGDVVLATSPTLVTPALGTPTALVLTNATGLPLGSTGVTGQLTVANGGTGLAALTAYDVLVGNGTGNVTLVSPGTSGWVLTSNGTGANPSFQAPTYSGTVTSVGLADASTAPIYTITNSPVTSSGTLTLTLNTELANKVFAGPASGSAAQPTFRSLVALDIPDLSGTYILDSRIGAASGVASLDGGGKIPLSQLPASLMEFQGNWNPNTNTPTLVDGTGVTGYTYWVSALDLSPVSGLTDPSMVNFQIGDLVIYNGTKWVLVTPAAGVQSVNGAQGAVTVNAINQLTGDITAGPASGSQSQVATLATVNASPGSTTLSSITTNGKGLVTSNTSATLASGDIWVGNGSNVPTAVAMSGDATISNTGVVTITGGLANHFITREIPSGSIPGSVFTLAHTPIVGSECVFLNGLLQESGATYDYTISGAVITFVNPLVAGDFVLVNYQI